MAKKATQKVKKNQSNQKSKKKSSNEVKTKKGKNEKKKQIKKVKETNKMTKSKSKKASTELNIDISKHILVPKHELLSEEEKEKVLKELGIVFRQLPKIKINDPAIKHLNAKPGDVIKIIRKSPISGEIVYYRGVIE